MFDDDEPPVVLFDPDRAVLIGSGHDLDAVGAMPDINLLRNSVEPDLDYRLRLLAKIRWLRGEGVSMAIHGVDAYLKFEEYLDKQTVCDIEGLPYLVRHIEIEMPSARGQIGVIPARLLDHEWRGPMSNKTTAPDETKPNHIRDAVRANL
jgi:hypothetical protein